MTGIRNVTRGYLGFISTFMQLSQKELKLIRRAAGIVAISFALLLSVFALDAWQSGRALSENLISLMMHLHTSFLILVFYLIARKYALAGAILFTLAGMAYIIWAWGRFPLTTYLIISGPLFLLGAAYLIYARGHRNYNE